MNKLTIFELGRLTKLEKVIEAGRRTFTEVGDSLLEIKETHLWREKYESFDDYCEKKWGWGRKRANQLISASVVVKGLTKETATIVATESQVRALSKVPAEKRVEVLEKARESGKPITAKVITETHENKEKDSNLVLPGGRPNAGGDKADPVLDETGYPIPEKAMVFWQRRIEVQVCINNASTIKEAVERAWHDGKDPDPLFFGKGKLTQNIITDLQALVRHLKSSLPYAVCPYCQGKLVEKCAMCSRTGMISQSQMAAVPEELRKVREKAIATKGK